MSEEPKTAPELLENPLFQELMEEGAAIQDRFAAEPVFARTGKGWLKSAGVSELAEIKKKSDEESNGSAKVAED